MNFYSGVRKRGSIIGLVICLVACKDDLKSAKTVAIEKIQSQIEKTEQVTIVYSDSAHVQATLKSPVLLHHKTANPYYEMPKGVHISFYNRNMQVVSTVSAKYALRKENERTIELQKDVRIANQKGEQFFSEEFIWDENTRKFHSNKPVTIITEGTTLKGTNFWSNEDFSLYQIQQSKGSFSVKSQ